MKQAITQVKVVPDLRRELKKSKYPLKLRITFNRERRYYGTGYKITLSDWDLLNSDKAKGKMQKLRNEIAEIETKAADVINTLDGFSFSDFEDQYFEKPIRYENLKSAFEAVIRQLGSEGRVGTETSYGASINALEKFRPNCKLNDVNVDFLKSFEQWMIGRKKSITTVGIYLRPLRAVINKAIEERVFDRNKYPFGKNRYIIPSGKKAKRSLSKEQLKSIFSHKPDKNNFFENRSLDFWKFTYLANGINMMDIAHLKWENVFPDFISFKRQKTRHTNRANATPITIVRTPELNCIIDKWACKRKDNDGYVFDIISNEDNPCEIKAKVNQFNGVTNDWMKRIGEKLGIDLPITTYVARHSFSTMLLRSGASVEFISESLGHTDIKTTQHYLGGFDIEAKKETMKVLTDFG